MATLGPPGRGAVGDPQAASADRSWFSSYQADGRSPRLAPMDRVTAWQRAQSVRGWLVFVGGLPGCSPRCDSFPLILNFLPELGTGEHRFIPPHKVFNSPGDPRCWLTPLPLPGSSHCTLVLTFRLYQYQSPCRLCSVIPQGLCTCCFFLPGGLLSVIQSLIRCCLSPEVLHDTLTLLSPERLLPSFPGVTFVPLLSLSVWVLLSRWGSPPRPLRHQTVSSLRVEAGLWFCVPSRPSAWHSRLLGLCLFVADNRAT